MTRGGLASVLAVALSACWAMRIPPTELTHYRDSVRSAEAQGAQGVPAARLRLTLARHELATAERLASDGDPRSRVALACAQVDAEVSVAMAREASMHHDALRAAVELLTIQDRGGQ